MVCFCTEYYYFVVKLDNMAIPICPVILLFYTDGPLPKFNIILTRKLLAQDICLHVYDFNDTIGPSLHVYDFNNIIGARYLLNYFLHVYNYDLQVMFYSSTEFLKSLLLSSPE